VTSPRTTHDVVVVGAGVIGTAVARACAQRGLDVALLDPRPGTGASYAAAGMLAPATEAHVGEESLLGLGLASAARWPAFAAALTAETGADTGWSDAGTVMVAADADDKRVLAQLHDFQTSLGLGTERLTSREVRTLEPLLSPEVVGGLSAPADHSVDNRRLMAVLATSAADAGTTQVRGWVRGLLLDDDGSRAVGVVLDDGRAIGAGTVVLAGGARSGLLEGLPDGALPPVRPVKGQILRLRSTADTGRVLHRTVRAFVHGASVYLVPRADGEVVVGATMEERGFDDTVTAGGMWELLRDARVVLPVVTELELVEAWAGLRPGTPDNLPLIGASALDGLVLATGHGRNGILLAPLTADAVASLVADGAALPEVAAADPRRFEAVRSAR
jgi:glycine oxidase